MFLFRAYIIFYDVFFIGYMLNAVEKNDDIYLIWTLVGISIVVMVVYDYLSAWFFNTYKPYADQNIYIKYKLLVFNKASEVDLNCYENIEFFNKYTKASNEIIKRVENILNDFLETIVDLFMNTYLFFLIFQLDVFATIICFFPILIKYILGKKLNIVNYNLYTENVEYNRHKDYIKRVIYLKDYSKEIRTSNIFNLLSEKFQIASTSIILNIKKYGIKIALLDFLNSSLFVLFTYFIAIIYVSYKAIIIKALSIGDSIILINAIARLSNMLIRFVDKVLRFNENSKYVDNIKEFLNVESKISDCSESISITTPFNIEFKDVSFVYDGQNEFCLKNININNKDKIAIVGLNGAGKTTLINLLMRLYDTSKGEILINGNNIKNYIIKDYRSIFATVFQDYKIFATTVAENVLLDVVNDKVSLVFEALNNSGIYQKLHSICKTETSTEMLNRVLTKEFDNDGLVLSGGEFQKIAISRVFIKEGGIAILDEPSSALDLNAEKEMFKNLLFACKEKTIIFISHRLSAAALADKIYVMKDGYIAEAGTHTQLMNNKGIYYDMYKKQNKRFINSGELDSEET